MDVIPALCSLASRCSLGRLRQRLRGEPGMQAVGFARARQYPLSRGCAVRRILSNVFLSNAFIALAGKATHVEIAAEKIVDHLLHNLVIEPGPVGGINCDVIRFVEVAPRPDSALGVRELVTQKIVSEEQLSCASFKAFLDEVLKFRGMYYVFWRVDLICGHLRNPS
jgi:hypothetical protein